MTRDEIIEKLDRDAAEQIKRTRAVIVDMGRPDIAAEFDRNMKNLRLGVTGARNAWHSLSPAQRRTLEVLSTGRRLVRSGWSINFYDANGEPHALGRAAGLKTVRNLAARELLDWDGGATDPEKAAVLSERGRFVLNHGPV